MERGAGNSKYQLISALNKQNDLPWQWFFYYYFLKIYAFENYLTVLGMKLSGGELV